MRRVLAVLVTLVVAVTAQQFRATPDTPAWKSLQTLAGKWEGMALRGDKEMGGQHTQVEVRRTADGSALMLWMDAGTTHEMVTMSIRTWTRCWPHITARHIISRA